MVLGAFIVGMAAGVLGTGSGGLITSMLGTPSRRVLSGLLGTAAGIMFSVVITDLMPEAIATAGLPQAVAGFMLGTGALGLMDLLAPHIHPRPLNSRKARFIRVGIMAGIGIAAHNFPEGLAIGASLVREQSLGLSVALILALHNLPEGMAMSAPMMAAGLRGLKVTAFAAAAGIPMGIGALLGSWFGSMSPYVLSVGLGFASGAMVFVACRELLPGAREFSENHSGTIGVAVGIMLGLILTHIS